MGRLTEKDACGHWRLKGLPWKNLYEGTPITRETYEVLYGALCKLLAYEETGLTPEEIEMRTYCTMGTPCEFQSSKIRKDGWIPVEERLPEEKVNPVSQDFYEYQVTAQFGNVKDVRHYKYGNGHWWQGPGIVDKYVIAWRENPEPYRPERSDNHD